MELEDRLGHVFPQNWNVSERMAVQFCELTSRMVSDLLSQRSGKFSNERIGHIILDYINRPQLH